MSVTQDVRTETRQGEVRPRTRSSALSTKVNRVLFSTSRWQWVALDLIVVVALYELGIRLSPYGGYQDLVSPYVALSVVYGVAYSTIALGLGHYDRDTRFDYLEIIRNALMATVLASLASVAFHYFTLYAVVGRLTLVYGAVFAFAGVTLLRGMLAATVRRHPYRFSVIGGSGPVSDMVREWAQHKKQARIYQLVPWESLFADPRAPSVEELQRADIAEIVVATDSATEQEAIDFALTAFRANVPVVDERSFYSHLSERLPLDDMSKRWILEHGIARPQGVVVATKRAADLLLSGLGLVILSPVMLAIGMAIKVSSPGPALFVQQRQGRFNEPFRMLKFRTMQHNPGVDSSFTRHGDVRVHRIGRILRRTHLDELPQLINVLRGEMSLVGPRPETLEFATRMDEELPLYELRYLVRPGLTGHAQLKQGYAMDSALDTRTKLSYDLYYLCNYSLRLDVRILLRTALFLTRGAR